MELIHIHVAWRIPVNDLLPQKIESNRMKLILIARWGYVLLGIFWFVLGSLSVADFINLGGTFSGFDWIISCLVFLNALGLVFIGWMLGKGQPWIYYFGLFVLGMNILLTFTDQFGIIDFIYLVLCTSLFVYLLITRAHYTRQG